MKNIPTYLIFLILFFFQLHVSVAQTFALEDIKTYPFPTALTTAPLGNKIAWAFDEQGKRNIYVADGPEFEARKLTNYTKDDGQELTGVSIAADGKWVVYVRGGDHGSNWGDLEPVNPAFDPMPNKVSVWAIPFAGGEPKLYGEGDAPLISPKSDKVVYLYKGQVWITSIDGSDKPSSLFTTRGSVGSLQWSPDGSKLAFVADRDDHELIGIYSFNNNTISWMAPSFSKDSSPRWSRDGSKIAFVRTPGDGGIPKPLLTRQHRPWSIWVGDVASGVAKQIWESPKTLAGSRPTTHGGTNLHWGAGDRIAFLAYHDGWPHLYSISSNGGQPTQLTKGNFMCEYISITTDGKWLMASANTGTSPLDIDRRHIIRVPIDKPQMEVLTPGDGLEWAPHATGDGSNIVLISATAQRPPLPAVMKFSKGTPQLIAQKNIPQQFPQNSLIVPKQITFQSPDGFTIHGQLFEPKGGSAKKPALIYVHGGPPRQMLLGWHYSDYYSNAYSINQYLANLGFVVITVNYRLGIGYGYEFHQPEKAGSAGASEYIDVKAAGEWLAKQSNVDSNRIGIYGGSYGGFLTAMALGRDSKLFAAGVDIHGVHDRTVRRTRNMLMPDSYERAPDAEEALKVAWESSPVSSVPTWTSPVLIIHADDDRNVRVSESTDLVQRLQEKGVPMETLMIVDDTHHWMKWSNAVKVGNATADFFKRQFMKK
ncbi:MAG TPA: peptidase S9 [Cytophagales bacterium]|nr:peptidase S9 [Cytophagales bacterium]HCR52971.1 peptidase S9 [Cytophagales bacterium]